MSAVSVLKACPLFKAFTDTGLQILAGICDQRTFAKGVSLFTENDLAESMFVLSGGRVALRTRGPGQVDLALGELGKGDYLGEMCLVRTGHRLCTAMALEPVVATEIRYSDFQKLLVQKPQACIKLLMAVFEQLARKLADSREELKAALPRK